MRTRPSQFILCGAFLMLWLIGPFAQPAAPYREVWYTSGTLRIQAYLYTPDGPGPFPVVIYNHGSRPGHERQSRPETEVAQMLTATGYMVLEPARRGYGKSDGEPASEVFGSSRGDAYVQRLSEDADDVLAAVEFLKTIHSADLERIAMIGSSEGGTVTIIAASRSPRTFACIVDQAGGAGSWDRSPQLQRVLRAAAARIDMPLLAMVAENDRTTASVRAVVEEAQKAHKTARLIVYPPYTPPAEGRGRRDTAAPGHRIFSPGGIPSWQADVRAFLDGCLRVPARVK